MKNTSLDSGFLASNITSRSILAARIAQFNDEQPEITSHEAQREAFRVEREKSLRKGMSARGSKYSSTVKGLDYNVDASTWK
jgi:hypothetical protein